MRRSTRTQTTFAVALALLLIGAVASAQNLRVMGTTTVEGESSLRGGVRAPFTMTSPDSTNIYALTLARTNENGRSHRWSWWHMNTGYGQDSLQLYEYQTDSAGNTCGTVANRADGAMCDARLTVAKGGNVGVGVSQAAYRLDVAGEIHSTGAVKTEGTAGWISAAYGGGWYMQDTSWIRTYGNKAVWSGGAIAAGNSDLYFTSTTHNHTGYGNTTGFAAIENAANYGTNGTLMVLGRSGSTLPGGGVGRRVDLWDYLNVNGSVGVTGSANVTGSIVAGGAVVNGRLRSTTGTVVYTANASCNIPSAGSLTLQSTCVWWDSYYGWSQTYTNTVVGRLVDPWRPTENCGLDRRQPWRAERVVSRGEWP